MEEHQNQLRQLARQSDGEASETDIGDNDSESSNGGNADDSWEGFAGPPAAVDYQAEYIDEDKFTMVTVEELDPSKEGLYKSGIEEQPHEEQGGDEDEQQAHVLAASSATKPKPGSKKRKAAQPVQPKKKKKFHYETKEERKVTRIKERLSSRRKASARKRK